MHVNEPLLAFSKKCVTDNCILVYLSYKNIFWINIFIKPHVFLVTKQKHHTLQKIEIS